jgi:DNA polymerase-3 subunit beta
MEIKVPRAVLENRVSQLVGFLNKRENDVTSHIYIEGSGEGVVTLRATDRDLGLEVKISGEVVEPGAATLEGKKFANLLKATKRGDLVELKKSNGEVEVSVGNYRFRFGSYDPEEFPEFPVVEGDRLPISVEQLVTGFQKVLHTIDTNSPKPELNCGLVDIREKELRLVGSDTRRMGIFRLEVGGREEKFLIPRKGLIELGRVYTPEMELIYDETFLIGRSDQLLFFSRLCGGKFPTYDPIIPKEYFKTFTLPKVEFRESLRPLLVFSQEVFFRFLPDGVVLESQASAVEGSGEVKIPVETGVEEEYRIGVNGKYLLDFLAVVEGEEFQFGVQEDPTKPFAVWEKEYLEIMMPLIL